MNPLARIPGQLVRGGLRNVLNRVMHQPIKFHKTGLNSYGANLGDGTSVKIFPGGMEHNARIKIIRGDEQLIVDAGSTWRNNWETDNKVE